MSDVNYSRGCAYSLQYHLVFCVKYRHKVLTENVEIKLKEILTKIASDNNFKIILMNGNLDHIHLLIECTPENYIQDMMKSLKGVSARLLMKEYPSLKKVSAA